jgi:hypothetical protein
MDTADLTGRPLVEDDLVFVSRVWNDERVAPTIGGVRTEQQLNDRIERWGRHWKAHGFGATLFQERTTGQPIGWGGLQHSTIGIGDRLTVGYVIAPEAWGRGYATEVAIASWLTRLTSSAPATCTRPSCRPMWRLTECWRRLGYQCTVRSTTANTSRLSTPSGDDGRRGAPIRRSGGPRGERVAVVRVGGSAITLQRLLVA